MHLKKMENFIYIETTFYEMDSSGCHKFEIQHIWGIQVNPTHLGAPSKSNTFGGSKKGQNQSKLAVVNVEFLKHILKKHSNILI